MGLVGYYSLDRLDQPSLSNRSGLFRVDFALSTS
jgi:hypothetical protein